MDCVEWCDEEMRVLCLALAWPCFDPISHIPSIRHTPDLHPRFVHTVFAPYTEVFRFLACSATLHLFCIC